MSEKYAAYIAGEISQSRGVHARVGSHTTNGKKRFVIHVTHDVPKEGIRPRPYTLTSAP